MRGDGAEYISKNKDEFLGKGERKEKDVAHSGPVRLKTECTAMREAVPGANRAHEGKQVSEKSQDLR